MVLPPPFLVPPVQAFTKTGKQEDETCIDPSRTYLKELPKKQRQALKASKLSVIILWSVLMKPCPSSLPPSTIGKNCRRRGVFPSISDDGKSKPTAEIRRLSLKWSNSTAKPAIASVKSSLQPESCPSLHEPLWYSPKCLPASLATTVQECRHDTRLKSCRARPGGCRCRHRPIQDILEEMRGVIYVRPEFAIFAVDKTSRHHTDYLGIHFT